MELEDQKVIIVEAIEKHAGLKPVQSPAKRLSFLTSENGRVLIYTSFKKRICFHWKTTVQRIQESRIA